MTEEKRPYILYEYLLYFWKQKWFFVIIPLIMAVLIAGAVYVVKSKGKPAYTGEATVFTGTTTNKELTNPDTIAAKFPKIKSSDDVFVSEKGVVKITIHGETRDAVTKDLRQITTQYQNELNKDAKHRIHLSKEYITRLNNQLDTYNETMVVFNKATRNEKLDPSQLDEVARMMQAAEDTVSSSSERVYKLKTDVELYEQPKVLSETVNPKKTYLPQSIAIGIILGLVLTVALLILLKYLGDARRYYKQHD